MERFVWNFVRFFAVVITTKTIIVIITVTMSPLEVEAGESIFCQGEVFKARCSYDEVVVMKSSTYGRMELSRCVKVDMGHLGCRQVVLDLADLKCSGRRSCEISVPDKDFESTKPCLELQSYLEASYECHKVATVESNECRSSRFLRTTQQRGSIASVTLKETWCGSKDIPWLIQGSKGQQINLTLVDFSAPRNEVQAQGTGHSPPHHHQHHNQQQQQQQLPRTTTTAATSSGVGPGCDEYAIIVEHGETPKETAELPVCGRNARHQVLYISRGHVVQVQIETKASEKHFLINYEIVGCTDPILTGDVWFKREDTNKAFVGCKNSAQRKEIACLNGVWDGEFSNCSDAAATHGESMTSSGDTQATNSTTLIAVIVIIIVIPCCLFLLVVYFYRRYRRMRHHHHHHHHQCDYPTPASIKSKSSLYGTEEEMDDHHHNHHHHHHLQQPHHHHHHHHQHQQKSYTSSGSRSLRYGHHHHHHQHHQHHGSSYHHHHQQHQHPHRQEQRQHPGQYEKRGKDDSPTSRGACSDYGAANYEKMEDDDGEVFPLPLPEKTKTKNSAVSLGASGAEKFTHIWETPLPVPGE